MKVSALLLASVAGLLAVGCSSTETKKDDAPDVVAVESADELTEGMYYYHYDPKTGKETIKGNIPSDKMEEIKTAKATTKGKVKITACSESYKQKYLANEPTDTVDPVVIDFRDSTIVNMTQEQLDSMLNEIRERVMANGEA